MKAADPGCRKRSLPLGQRISRMLLPVLVAILVIGGFALHRGVERLLISQFDLALLTKVRTLTSFPEPGRVGINLGFTERQRPEFSSGPHLEYFQVWLHDGSTLAKSASLPADVSLPRMVGTLDAPRFFEVDLPDGAPGRAVGVRLQAKKASLKDEFSVDLVLARGSRELSRLLQNLTLGVAGGGGVLLVLAWLGVRQATATALQPVSKLAREVAGIDAGSLKTRLPVDDLPPDLQPIVVQTNHLMQRLENAFSRERRFSANSAHELLTPVSELRAAAEAALEWPNDPQATASLAAEARDLAIQMEHVVRSLLALSRAEASLTQLRVEEFDLATLISEVIEERRDQCTLPKLTIRSEIPSPLSMRTDLVLMRSILKNIIQNACEYSVPGSEVSVRASVVAELIEIRVVNRSETINTDELARFGEPFWRRDAAHKSREHVGLGLALSRAFAHLLGGELSFDLELRHSVVARLVVPIKIKGEVP